MEEGLDNGIKEIASVKALAICPNNTDSKRIAHSDSSGKHLIVKVEQVLEGQNGYEFEKSVYEPIIDVESTESDQKVDVVHDAATETSSSFGYISSDCDSESDCGIARHQGSDAVKIQDGPEEEVANAEKDEEHGELHARNRKGLNAEWKDARRGIEWRCQWLALRVKELQMRASKYDRILAYLEPDSVEKAQSELQAARVNPTKQSMQGRHVFRRKNRKKVEVGIQLESHFARHPVFSRYGCDGDSKTKKKAGDTVAEELRHEESDLEERERSAGDEGGVGGQDSMEQLLWKVDLLQKRVGTLKQCLIMGAPVEKGFVQSSHVCGGPQQSPASPAVASAIGMTTSSKPGGTGSSYFRRRAADYDIDNMVMPVNVGAKFVEIVKPAHIETPQWRLADESVAAGEQESSSEEATDEETFVKRHTRMEIRERQQRNLPPYSKRVSDGNPLRTAGTKEKVKGAENRICEVKQEPNEEINEPWSSEFVPRKKRSRAPRIESSASKDLAESADIDVKNADV